MTEKTYIAGIHAVQAALKTDPNNIKKLYLLRNRRDERLQKIITAANKLSITCTELSRDELDRFLPNIRHQGVVAELISKVDSYSENDLLILLEQNESNLFLILDGVQDPHNLGACLRTANAANVTAVIAPKDRAATLTPTVRKVACGAAETTPFISVTNLVRTLELLKQHNVWIYGLAGEADTEIYNSQFTGSVALVLGSEGIGLRHLTRQHCDSLLRIPMYGTVESLNVSVATGICLFEVMRQRSKNRN